MYLVIYHKQYQQINPFPPDINSMFVGEHSRVLPLQDLQVASTPLGTAAMVPEFPVATHRCTSPCHGEITGKKSSTWIPNGLRKSEIPIRKFPCSDFLRPLKWIKIHPAKFPSCRNFFEFSKNSWSRPKGTSGVMPKQPSSPAARLVKPGLGGWSLVENHERMGYWKNAW